MKYHTAKRIVDQALSFDENFNDLVQLIDEIDDPNLRFELRRATASVVGSIYGDILLPLKRRFPELDVGDG